MEFRAANVTDMNLIPVQRKDVVQQGDRCFLTSTNLWYTLGSDSRTWYPDQTYEADSYPACHYVVKSPSTWNPAATSAADLDGCTTLAVGERVLCPSEANVGVYVASSATVCVADPSFVVRDGYTVRCVRSSGKPLYQQTASSAPAVFTRAKDGAGSYDPCDFCVVGTPPSLTNITASYFDVGSGTLAADKTVLIPTAAGSVTAGLYTLSANSPNWNLTPRVDFLTDADVRSGAVVQVINGHTNARESYTLQGSSLATARFRNTRGDRTRQAKIDTANVDNAPILTAALTQLGSTGILELPASTSRFHLTTPIYLTQSHITIRGAGRDYTRLVIDVNPASYPLSVAVDTTVEELTIEGIEVDGNEVALYFLAAFGGALKQLNVYNCRFLNIPGASFLQAGGRICARNNQFYYTGAHGSAGGIGYALQGNHRGGIIEGDSFLNLDRCIEVNPAEWQLARDLTIRNVDTENHHYTRGVARMYGGLTYASDGTGVTYSVAGTGVGMVRDAAKVIRNPAALPGGTIVRCMPARVSGTALHTSLRVVDNSTDFVALGVLEGEIVSIQSNTAWGIISVVETHALTVEFWYDPITLARKEVLLFTSTDYVAHAVYMVQVDANLNSSLDDHVLEGVQGWVDMRGEPVVPNSGGLLNDGVPYMCLSQNGFPIACIAPDTLKVISKNLIIDGARCCRSYSDMIALASPENAIVTNCILHWPQDTGIDTNGPAAKNCLVHDNIIYRAGSEAFAIEGVGHKYHHNQLFGIGWNGRGKATLQWFAIGSNFVITDNVHDMLGLAALGTSTWFPMCDASTGSYYARNFAVNRPAGSTRPDYMLGAAGSYISGANVIDHNTSLVEVGEFFGGEGAGGRSRLILSDSGSPRALACSDSAIAGSLYTDTATGNRWQHNGETGAQGWTCAGGRLFTPAVLNRTLWIRSNDVTLDGSGKIQTFTNHGADSAPITQATSGLRPALDVDNSAFDHATVANFSVASAIGATSGVSALTIATVYVVAKLSIGTGTYRTLLNVGPMQLRVAPGDAPLVDCGGGTNIQQPSALASDLHVYAIVYNGTSSAFYVDGFAAVTGTLLTTAFSQCVIGAYDMTGIGAALGWIPEVLIYNGAHSATTIASYMSWLKSRYADV